MQITIEALTSALDTVTVVPQRPGITSSEFIELKLVANKLKLYLASEVIGYAEAPCTTEQGEKWVFHVDRSLLVPFIAPSRGKEGEISFELNDTTLTVKAGRRVAKYQAPGEPVKGYGTAPAADDEKPLNFKTADVAHLQLAAKYVNQDALKPELTSIHVGPSGIVAAQSTIYFHIRHKVGVEGFIPPMFPDLLKGTGWEVRGSSSGMRVAYPDGYVYQLLNDAVVKGFPTQVILTNLKAARALVPRFVVKAGRFHDVFSRLKGYVAAVGSGGNNVFAVGAAGDKALQLAVRTPQATFDERLLLAEPLAADLAETLHLEWLIPFLEHLSSNADATVTVRWADDGPLVHYIDDSGVFELAHGRFAADPNSANTKKKATKRTTAKKTE